MLILNNISSYLSSQLAKQRGFSLLETAIVLGLVGLVIGGIWVAAGAVSYQFQKQRFFQGMLSIQRLSDKYLTQTSACTATGPFSDAGGSFIANTAPTIYALLHPPEWETIDLNKFVWSFSSGGNPHSVTSQISCDANGVRAYNVFLAFWPNPNFCMEAFNYLKARGVSVGTLSGGEGANNCGVNSTFNISFPINRPS